MRRRDAIGEAAFAALVSRHGPMVLELCRQVLGDSHHAEDAFQAVFLVLARRGRSIGNPDLLSNWLYGVALRSARCARHQLARRRDKPEIDAVRHLNSFAQVEPADRLVIDRERADILHDEIARLPQVFRLPVVLCYFEGLTLDEAARRLRCPSGTLRSRLARARDKLRRRLTRRGFALPAVALTAVLEGRSASASVSSSLGDITTRAAMKFAAGSRVGSTATAIAQEMLRAMLLNKLKLGMMASLVFAAVTAGRSLCWTGTGASGWKA